MKGHRALLRFFFFYNFIYLFIFGYTGSLLLHRLFSSCRAQASHFGGLRSTIFAIVVVHGLSCMWDLLGEGSEPVAPGFFTTQPPGKPWAFF